MNVGYGIVILLIICGVLSTIELDCIKEKKNLFWKISFYFGAYWFIASLVKYYLGYHRENLIESFWNMQFVTFIHYGIPLVVIAVAAPIALKLLFRETVIEVIRYFDSALFFTLSFTFFFVRKINNRTYCAAFLLAIIVTLFAIVFKKIRGVYTSKSDIKTALAEIMPILLLYLVTIVIYPPNELYLNNAADFPMSYWYFFWKLLLAGVIVTLFLMTGMLLYLNQKHMKLYRILLFAFLTIGYIQGLFLNGSMGILDGTENNKYSDFTLCTNLCVWIFLIGIIHIFSWKKYEAAQRIMKMISIWIILIQIVSLGTMIITSKDTSPKSELALTTEGMNEVGEKNNIIVFVLDKFDGSYIDEITEEEPDFLQPLHDFTFYQNASSAFCPTGNSIPFLLTGTVFEEERGVDYASYAYEKHNLLNDISEHGYDVGVYTSKNFVSESMKSLISNYEDGIKRTCSMGDLFAMMTQCSRYKMAPFAAKGYYIYDTSDITLLVVNDKIVNIENDIPFYRRLVEKGLHVSEGNPEGTFRFIHMHGAHPPYTMTEDFQYIEHDYRRGEHGGRNVSQWKGALKIVYEYMRQLKELDKYDESFIVITADHGMTNGLSDEDGNMFGISFPILFVKEPYETHEYIEKNQAPVCHADLIATLRRQIGMNVSDRTLREIGNDEDRVRYMYNSTADGLDRYEIEGEVSQIKSWRFLYQIPRN